MKTDSCATAQPTSQRNEKDGSDHLVTFPLIRKNKTQFSLLFSNVRSTFLNSFSKRLKSTEIKLGREQASEVKLNLNLTQC